MSPSGRPKGEYRSAQREGSPMSAAGQFQGRLHEQGEAKARRARPQVLAVADTGMPRSCFEIKEAARNSAPSGGSAAAPSSMAASVGGR